MTNGTLWLVNMYAKEHMKLVADITVLFGDNMQKIGLGGQAKACRTAPNCVGIPTKWKPDMLFNAFFNDGDITEVKPFIEEPFRFAVRHLEDGNDVAYPYFGIGTGHARLEHEAPKIHALILEGEKRLKEASDRQIRANNLKQVAAHKIAESMLPK
jgi:hypothetical protein